MCTINSTIHFTLRGDELFKRLSKVYVFNNCPILSEDDRCYFKSTSTLCITGSISSGKSLLLLYIISDLISENENKGTVLYIDTELTFNLGLLRTILSQINPDKTVLEKSLSRLIYLPIRNTLEFSLIVNILDIYLLAQNYKIDAIVVDSFTFWMNKWIATYNDKFRDFYIGGSFKKIMEMCKKYHIFLIYTKLNEANTKTVLNVKVHNDLNTTKCVANFVQVETIDKIKCFIPDEWLTQGGCGKEDSYTLTLRLNYSRSTANRRYITVISKSTGKAPNINSFLYRIGLPKNHSQEESIENARGIRDCFIGEDEIDISCAESASYLTGVHGEHSGEIGFTSNSGIISGSASHSELKEGLSGREGYIDKNDDESLTSHPVNLADSDKNGVFSTSYNQINVGDVPFLDLNVRNIRDGVEHAKSAAAALLQDLRYSVYSINSDFKYIKHNYTLCA